MTKDVEHEMEEMKKDVEHEMQEMKKKPVKSG
jgi:hypothetical protein